MAYFSDLSPYHYFNEPNNRKIVNIGWLEKGFGFPVGECEEEILDRIFALLLCPKLCCMGFHTCSLCYDSAGNVRPSGSLQPVAERNGKKAYLGNGEIIVKGKDGMVYHAPTLIYHYMTVHQYLPPAEFLDAVRALPLPRENWLSSMMRKWRRTSE